MDFESISSVSPNIEKTDESSLSHGGGTENDSASKGPGNVACLSDTSSDSEDQDDLLKSNKSLLCFRDVSLGVIPVKFWNVPFKFLQVAARELSVLLILIETLILLGGYLIILGVHYCIRYTFKQLRYKGYFDDGPSRDRVGIRHQNLARLGGIPRRVPRGRMAGG